MIKSKFGMLCTLYLISGFLLGSGTWESILAGATVGLISIINFKDITEEELK